jgi:signal transduction histidine kinase
MAALAVIAWWAAALISTNTVAAACFFAALAAGVVLCTALDFRPRAAWGLGRHPVSLVMILASLPFGVLMLLPLGPFRAAVYAPVLPRLPWLGAAFVLGAACLLVAELQRRARGPWSLAGRVALAAAWVGWIFTLQIPYGLPTLIPAYAGFSLLLLLEPTIRPQLPQLDATTLGARISVTLTAAIAVPIFVGMGAVSTYEEYTDRESELQQEEAQASALAASLGMHLTRMAALASVLAEQPAAAPNVPSSVYRSQGMLGATILDARGRALWMESLPAGFSLSEVWRGAPGPGGSAIAIVNAGLAHPVVLVEQSIGNTGNTAAVVADTQQMHAWIAPVLTLDDAHILVLDHSGGALVELGARPRLLGADATPDAPIAYLRSDAPTPTGLAYTSGGEVLAGIARVPATDWGIVSERTATVALAVNRDAQALSFIVMLLVLGLAAGVGIVTAQALARPLERLAAAIRQVARDGRGTDLPRSSIGEIRSLAADFEDMQRQLARREAEERQARAQAESDRQAAESALRLRDVFLRTLAHDLKTPLAGIMWQSEFLLRRVRDGRLEPAVLDEGLRAIETGSAESIAAIDELHDLTRVAAGAPLPLERERVDLVALAQHVASTCPQATRERIHFESRATSVWVEADPARIGRVLQNLLDNAAKYSARDQPVIVGVDRELRDGVEWAVLRVHDSGIGIAAEDLPHIFDLYHRGNNVESIEGEGVGLASVRQLVELHGGQVEVQSEEGAGTVFSVRLPLATSAPAVAVPEVA